MPFQIKLPRGIDTDAELIEIAMKGKEGRFWYENSAEVMQSFKDNSIGKFLPETFVRLIGATGQGTAPRDNFTYAVKYMNRMMAGVYGNAKEDPHEAINNLKSSGILNGDGRYNISTRNIADAMMDTDLSTRKLGDYTRSFLGETNIVTADEWMNRLITGKTGAPSSLEYDYIEGRVRHIARIMKVEPMQAQAML